MISLLILVSALFFSALFLGISWAPVVLSVTALLWVALLVAELRDLKLAPVIARATSRSHRRVHRSMSGAYRRYVAS